MSIISDQNSRTRAPDRRVPSIPRLATAPVHRHGLCSYFERARSLGGGVVLACGMAGTGKTVAVTEWLHCSGLLTSHTPVGWVTLTEEHNDPESFWDALHSSFDDSVPDRIGTWGREEAPCTRAEIFSEWLGKFENSAVLVLDDAHSVHDPLALSGLGHLLEILPRHITVVVASRFPPALPWHRLDMTGTLVRVDSTDLSFGRDDTGRILASAGTQVTDDELDATVALTGGWAAMVRLMTLLLSAHSLTEHGEALRILTSITASGHPAISDFLVGELLDTISAEQRDFLIRTAVPDSFDTDLATELVGPGSARILSEILASHFPISHTGAPGTETYCYHPLMRAHLKAELDRTLGRDAVRRIELRVGSWYSNIRNPVQAIRHLVAAHDRYALSKCLLDLGPKAVFGLHGAAFLKVLDDAPPDIADDPFVHLLRSVHAIGRHAPAEAESFLRAASARSSSICPADLFDHFHHAAEIDVRSALGSEIAETDFPDPVTGHRDIDAYTAVQQAKSVFSVNDERVVTHRLHASVSMAEFAGSTRPHLEALMLLAVNEGARGRLSAMSARALVGIEFARAAGLSGTGNADRCAVMCRYYHFLAGTRAPDGVDTSLSTPVGKDGLSSPTAGWDSYTLSQLLTFHESADKVEAAHEITASIRAALTDSPIHALSAPIISLATRALVTVHECDMAQRIIEAATAELGAQPEFGVATATVEHARGRSGRARELLDSVLAHPPLHLVTAIEAHVLRAVLRTSSGHEFGAYDDLESALALAEPEQLVRPFLAIDGGVSLLDTHSGRFGRLDAFVESIRTHPDATHSSTNIVLTPAERRVLKQLPSPRTTQEIAEALALSVNTVKTHLRGVYGKLGVSSRGDAIRAARVTGML